MSVSTPSVHLPYIIVGFGGTCIDYLAVVASFPNPDDKTRCKSMLIQGGGDAANTMTCAARLGLKPRLISMVADDIHGKAILEELEADAVDTSFMVVRQQGRTPFSYVIVDQETGTRTCIFTPGHPEVVPADLSQINLTCALSDAKIAYFDARYTDTALRVAQEASQMNIPILVDAEKKRPWFDSILMLAKYAVCAAKFPQTWTGAPSIATALVSMLWRLPKLMFVIVTLGEKGCIMIERIVEDSSPTEEMDVDSLLASLEQQKDSEIPTPTCIPSAVVKLRAKDIGTVTGRLIVGTAERIPPAELIDTTGAGDSFIGAILYALCTRMTPEKMLPFAAKVAASCCRSLGARTGLPHRTDPCLAPYLGAKHQEEIPQHNYDPKGNQEYRQNGSCIIPPNLNDEAFGPRTSISGAGGVAQIGSGAASRMLSICKSNGGATSVSLTDSDASIGVGSICKSKDGASVLKIDTSVVLG